MATLHACTCRCACVRRRQLTTQTLFSCWLWLRSTCATSSIASLKTWEQCGQRSGAPASTHNVAVVQLPSPGVPGQCLALHTVKRLT